RSVGSDRNGLAHLAYWQVEVYAHRRVDVNDDVLAHNLLEALLRSLDAVDAVFDVREGVVAVGVGRGGGADVSARLGDGDGRAGSRRAVGIGDGSEQAAFDGLRVADGRQRE